MRNGAKSGYRIAGPFQMIRACAPELTKAEGAIVNVSSMAGALGIGTAAPSIASLAFALDTSRG